MSSGVAVPPLPRGLAGFRRLLALVGRAELVLAIGALLIVVALAIAQAALRYFSDISLWWAQEVAESTVLVTYFLGISYVFKTRQEIFIEFVSAMLPMRLQLVLYMLEQVLAAAFALTLLWLVWLFVPTMLNTQSPVLKLSGAVIYVPLVLSSISIAVTSVYYCAFGLWAYRSRVGGRNITDIEAHGLILRPWVEPS
jgi:TRAP-type C4-dicarboxylate transport system permease small subunit